MNLPGKLIGLSVGLLLLGMPLSGWAQRDKYRQVDPQDLLDSPQSYWSRGIVFRDLLVQHPGGRLLKISGKRYMEFQTKTLGTCYADRIVVPLLKEQPLDVEIIFTGTVLDRGSGWLGSRQAKYVVVVQEIEPIVVPNLDRVVHDLRISLDQLAAESGELWVRNFSSMIKNAQEGLESYAQSRGIELADLLDPDSDHAEKAGDLIRKAVREVATNAGTTSDDILSAFVRNTLQDQYVEEDSALPEPTPGRAVEEITPPPARAEPKTTPDTRVETFPVKPPPATIRDVRPSSPAKPDRRSEKPPGPARIEPPASSDALPRSSEELFRDIERNLAEALGKPIEESQPEAITPEEQPDGDPQSGPVKKQPRKGFLGRLFDRQPKEPAEPDIEPEEPARKVRVDVPVPRVPDRTPPIKPAPGEETEPKPPPPQLPEDLFAPVGR
jgi:hypothetical protein